MTVADNAISLRLLEDLCAELRARVELKSAAVKQTAPRLGRAIFIATCVANVLAVLTSVSLLLV